MFYKGQLYIRFDDNFVTELLYPLDDWGNNTNFPYFSLAIVKNGTQPSFTTKVFHGTPEGYKVPEGFITSGSFVKYEKATDTHILELLNFWNDLTSMFGTVKTWVEKVDKQCNDLHQYEKDRLLRLGKQSRYW